MNFKTKLEQTLLKKNSSLCIGIDPRLKILPPLFIDIQRSQGDLKAISYWAHSTLEIASAKIPAVKFQSAFFESYGSQGFELLRELCSKAKALGFHVILDAKRADISSTMEAYGHSAFDYFMADSLTVLPYMGSDILVALAPWLKAGKGLYLVWVSSNPSGKDVQLQMGVNSKTFAELILESFASRCDDLDLKNSFGLVLGATMLDQLPFELWQKAQKYPLLLPGLGAQGASTDHPKIKDICKFGSNLFPISRSLTSAENQEIDFYQAETVDSYQIALNARIQGYSQALAVSSSQTVS